MCVYWILTLKDFLAHNFDLLSDILYVSTVPTYSIWFNISMILFILLPVFISVYFTFKTDDDVIRDLTLMEPNFKSRLFFFFLMLSNGI